jgi:hypothetical protein
MMPINSQSCLHAQSCLYSQFLLSLDHPIPLYASFSLHFVQARQREAYLSYLEMLNKLQLFCAANSIVRTPTAAATVTATDAVTAVTATAVTATAICMYS